MAKKALRSYTFTPGGAGLGTIVVDSYWPLESFLLITNVTTQAIIYNFADPAAGGTVSYDATTNKTTLTLELSTSGQLSTHKLQIFVDDWRGYDMIPSETYQDPVSKLRVSTPQALIDTDFEYSTQPFKWESLAMISNYAVFFPLGSGATSLDLFSISGNGAFPKSTVTVTTNTSHGLQQGFFATIQDATDQDADGTFLITSTPSSNTFTYTAKGFVSGNIFDSSFTTVYGAGNYTYGNIPLSSVAVTSTNVVRLTTQVPHGLLPGTTISLINVSGVNPPNGDHVVTRVEGPFFLEFNTTNNPSSLNIAGSSLFPRPEGYTQHRALDGGVLITTGGAFEGAHQIRQTRRYFRYQSGKGIQFSTGVKFTPTYDIDSITASGSSVFVTTLQDHGLQNGAQIKVEGVVSGLNQTTDGPLYNRTTTVAAVTGTKSFTYSTGGSTPTDLAPGGTNLFVTCTGWSNAYVRTGLFDDQNGFFFEFDGQQLYCVRRHSVKELLGRVTAFPGSTTISGSGTRFREQLLVGDRIVVKGQVYKINNINDDTNIAIAPRYRAFNTASNARYMKVQEIKVPQSQWNLDKMDGTGPSGYTLDLSKMQMAYIDYTWYGAGFIRFGFRAVNGDIIYCHKMPNNNVNTSAYMRSGNLPGRFEVMNEAKYTRLVAGATATRGSTLQPSDSTMYVEDVTGWPSSGYIFISDTNNCELSLYNSIGAYNSTVRGWPLNIPFRRTNILLAGVDINGNFSSGAYNLTASPFSNSFTPDSQVGGLGSAQVSVKRMGITCTPTVSHWGVSVIMDGRYDDDKSVTFTTSMNRFLSIAAGARRPLMALRIAPSVDSGIARNFGIREIVNRMQLTLEDIEVYSTGQFLIEGILNPQFLTGGGLALPNNWPSTPVGGGSLAQIVYYDSTQFYNSTPANATGFIQGGDRIFAFYADNAGGTNPSTTVKSLKGVRDLGHSILGGTGGTGFFLNEPVGYPFGPDVLVIVAQSLEASQAKNVAARIAWTEAQA
jgi:hypothetical protein